MTFLRKDIVLVPAPSPEGVGPDSSLERRIDVLRHAADRVREGADEEAVHDARVCTRRLAALLDVWREELEPKPRRRAARELRRMRRRLGAAREREVSLERIRRALGEAVGEDAAALDTLAASLQSRLPKDRAKVERAARHGLVEEIVDDLRACLVHEPAQTRPSEGALERVGERVRKRRSDTLRTLDEALAHPLDDNLHVARIQAKKWRYGEEALAEARGAKTPPRVVSVLRALQDALGANQDRAVLAALLERAARREARRENAERAQALRSRAAALRAENAQRRAELASLRDRLHAEPHAPSPPSD
jgi:CHAD domain-containing protein